MTAGVQIFVSPPVQFPMSFDIGGFMPLTVGLDGADSDVLMVPHGAWLVLRTPPKIHKLS